MSGTTSLCLTQQWDNSTHEPLVGGLLYSFVAGTLTPQNAYRTAALTAGGEYSNPVTLDASGRIPQMFYTDGVVRLILTDSLGVAQFDYDNVPVIGSSGGSGGVDTTDVNRLFGTGDIKIKYGTGAIEGYVRGNGRTIGSATSGASEFADATAQALFQYFWNNDAALTVTPAGRGVSAVADWIANKQIATPDFRGRVIGGLDGMGNSRASIMSGAGYDTLGQAFGGLETHTLTQTQLPNYNLVSTSLSFTGTNSGTLTTGYQSGVPGQPYQHAHTHTQTVITNGILPAGGFNITGVASGSVSITSDATSTDHYHYFSLTPGGSVGGHVPSGGSGVAHNNTQPTRLVTVYFRL